MFKVLKNRNFVIMLVTDACLVGLSLFMAYFFRFDGNIPSDEMARMLEIVVWVIPVKFLCFFFFGLYKGMWRYTSLRDLKNLIKACLASTGTGIRFAFFRVCNGGRSYFMALFGADFPS